MPNNSDPNERSLKTPLTDYARGKISSFLKLLEREWDTEVAKDSLSHTSSEAHRNRTINVPEKRLLSWYKRERLEYRDLAKILDRMRAENVVLLWAFYEDERDVGPYWKDSFFEIQLPYDFAERLEEYRRALNPVVEPFTPKPRQEIPRPKIPVEEIRIVSEEEEDMSHTRKSRVHSQTSTTKVSGNFINYGQMVIGNHAITTHEVKPPKKTLLNRCVDWVMKHLLEIVFTTAVLAVASYFGLHLYS